MAEKQQDNKPGHLSPEKYTAKIPLLHYSISFAGAAAAFLITASAKLNIIINEQLLRWSLLLWGGAILSGFLQYVLTYREVWYYHRLPEQSRRRTILFPIELAGLYTAMTLHFLCMTGAIVLTIWIFWTSPFNTQQ